MGRGKYKDDDGTQGFVSAQEQGSKIKVTKDSVCGAAHTQVLVHVNLTAACCVWGAVFRNAKG